MLFRELIHGDYIRLQQRFGHPSLFKALAWQDER
jgi:hypothetical protein